jgi:hypothetical protein
MTIDLNEIIIDRSAKDKAALINRRRDELKPLGYSVVDSKWLAGIVAHANWMQPKQGSQA